MTDRVYVDPRVLFTPHDPRDYPLAALPSRIRAIQQNHDLRQYRGQSLCTPVRDQGPVGICTGFGWAGLREAGAAKYHIDQGTAADLGDVISPRFLYYYERTDVDHSFPQDAGASARAGGAVLLARGASPERFCPYTPQNYNLPISPEADAAAGYYGISAYYRLAGTGQQLVNSALQCLDESWPFVMAFYVYPSFENITSSGRVPMVRAGERLLGAHLTLVVGNYFDQSFPGGGVFVVKNSWSEGWGDGGYCYVPYAYFTQSVGNVGTPVSECWTLR